MKILTLKARFGIDIPMLVTFEGFMGADLQGDWAMPYFLKEDADCFAMAINGQLPNDEVTYDEKHDTFVFWKRSELFRGEDALYGHTTLHVYPIHGPGWHWRECR